MGQFTIPETDTICKTSQNYKSYNKEQNEEIEVIVTGTEKSQNSNALPEGYTIEKTTNTDDKKEDNNKEATLEKINNLEIQIKKDSAEYDRIAKKLQTRNYQSFTGRTPAQEKILCTVGIISMILGTLGTWKLDKKLEMDGILGFFSGFGLIGGGLATVVLCGATTLIIGSYNRKQEQKLQQLAEKISEEREELRQLNTSI